MSHPLTVAIALTALSGSVTVATADAPGACDTCTVPVSTPATPDDLARRWAIGARAVSLSLEGETRSTDYVGGGFAASFRLDRRWEVALAFDLLDAPQGRDLHIAQLSARFHLSPHQAWDWYLLAGVGVVHEVPLESEMEADHGSGRGQVHAGLGLARRFRWFSIGAELHAVGIGPREHDGAMEARQMPGTPPTTDDGLGGAELTLSTMLLF